MEGWTSHGVIERRRGSADAQMPAEMAQERRQPHLGDALRLNDAEREIAPQITWKQPLYGKVNDGLWYIGRCKLRTPVVPQHEENTRCEGECESGVAVDGG